MGAPPLIVGSGGMRVWAFSFLWISRMVLSQGGIGLGFFLTSPSDEDTAWNPGAGALVRAGTEVGAEAEAVVAAALLESFGFGLDGSTSFPSSPGVAGRASQEGAPASRPGTSGAFFVAAALRSSGVAGRTRGRASQEGAAPVPWTGGVGAGGEGGGGGRRPLRHRSVRAEVPGILSSSLRPLLRLLLRLCLRLQLCLRFHLRLCLRFHLRLCLRFHLWLRLWLRCRHRLRLRLQFYLRLSLRLGISPRPRARPRPPLPGHLPVLDELRAGPPILRLRQGGQVPVDGG